MGGRICIQRRHALQQLLFACVCRQFDQLGPDARFLTRLDLGANVGARCGIVANEDHGESRYHTVMRFQLIDADVIFRP